MFMVVLAEADASVRRRCRTRGAGLGAVGAGAGTGPGGVGRASELDRPALRYTRSPPMTEIEMPLHWRGLLKGCNKLMIV